LIPGENYFWLVTLFVLLWWVSEWYIHSFHEPKPTCESGNLTGFTPIDQVKWDNSSMGGPLSSHRQRPLETGR
jgi:hypothetical protein